LHEFAQFVDPNVLQGYHDGEGAQLITIAPGRSGEVVFENA